MEDKPKSIYRYAAEYGLWLGLCFCAMFLCMVWSEDISLLSPVATLLMLSVPVLTYIFLRRTYLHQHGLTMYAALWMEGIVMFALGGLMMVTMIYMYIRWIDPTLMERQVAMLIDVYKPIDTPRSRELTGILEAIRDNDAYPTARDVATQIELLTIFSGSILSMLMSLLVRLRGTGTNIRK